MKKNPKTILAVTGSRAEYGIMSRLLKKIDGDDRFILKLAVTGTHLSNEHGFTVDEIYQDGFEVAAEVEMLLSNDSCCGAAKSVGLAMIGFADTLKAISPDIIVILGDRMELMAVTTAAVIYGIPIAHIHGGETTEGAFDELFRHAITKMSQVHFASTDIYRKRILQMGERPENVFNVGALGVENTLAVPILGSRQLEARFGRDLTVFDFLVTLHPETGSSGNSDALVAETLAALGEFPEHRILFTGANSDPGGSRINAALREYAVTEDDRCAFYQHLGLQGYLSVLKNMTAVLGNSSSGIIEAPSFKIPTVNIGFRQKGRERAASIIDCLVQRDAIIAGIQKAIDMRSKAKGHHFVNPYEHAGTADAIIEALASLDFRTLSPKRFYDFDFTDTTWTSKRSQL